ncbi:hypothetical protein CMI37_28765 [Candidatus Pacearchaeota archaeon]|nr:hypothetical protein [Candidatus Pacearchaeota archaeon]|tara:strand:+ start:1270 stop:1461 length:192 start_codon:yes stop_codon:yes gene_type:complete
MSQQDTLYTTAEVADRLRVSVKTVLYWVSIGRLKGRKIGPARNSQHRFTEQDVQEFLTEGSRA